jgi:hypothetical protein
MLREGRRRRKGSFVKGGGGEESPQETHVIERIVESRDGGA